MKKNCLLLCLASLLGSAAAFAQTVATDPVGFINLTIQGGTQSQPGVTYVSPTLTNPIVFQGTIASISGTTINVNGASWAAGAGFNGDSTNVYYAEVFNATNPGALSDIVTTGASSVTTAQSLSAFASTGDSIRIRQHITINQLLGANNTYGLLGSAVDASTADNILVYSGGNQTTYWYYTGSPPTLSDAGWYDVVGNPAGAATIAPFEGVIVARRAAGNVTITSTGTVKTGNTLFPVAHGPNYLGTLSAQGLTLDSSGLATSGIVGSAVDATTSDQVLIYSSGVLNTYWYYTGSPPSLSDAGWYDVVGNPAGSTSLAPGASYIVNRINGGAFNWALPAPSSF